MEKIVFLDKKIRDEERIFFENLGYKVILIPTNNNLYDEISSHVDIHITKINNNNLIVAPCIYNFVVEKISKINPKSSVKVICGQEELYKNYPRDVAYNTCILKEYAISNFKHIDKVLLKNIEKNNIEKINVKQGYTSCNITKIDDTSVITCDIGIYNEISSLNENFKKIDIIYISKDELNIKLLKNNMEYSSMIGFLGGATCVVDKYFCIFGDVKNIKEKEANKIKAFVNKKGLILKSFDRLDIIDYGGIVVI